MSTDLRSAGVWSDLDDPELKELASQVPGTVLKSRADSSTKKYLGAYHRWRNWATSHMLPVFPASPRHIVLYLQSISNRLRSKSAAEEAVHAKPVQKKKPITVPILANMVEDINSAPTLTKLRITTITLLAFAGLMKLSISEHVTWR